MDRQEKGDFAIFGKWGRGHFAGNKICKILIFTQNKPYCLPMPRIQFLSALILALLSLNNAFAQKNQYELSHVSRTYAGDRGGPDPALRPFYHGVASGDPQPNSVVIWTRVTPDAGQSSISGKYFVATDTGFTQMVLSGDFTAEEARDYTVNIVLDGLQAGSVYYYYFQALGANSLIGRARTCPQDPVERLKFAVVSCANYEGGYFNVYDAISRRNDLDAVIHLGDYIYEYASGSYGINLPGRINEPTNEILTLADYRTRYSLYRLDPDLIRLHQQQTMISVWDDHESANDSWSGGAQNHNPGEGDWEVRKAISKQVYFEWMPIRPYSDQKIYREVSYGPLCDILMLDTRLEGRDEPPPHFDTPDVPQRNIISQTQFDWLAERLKNSPAHWKVIGNQVLFSTFNVGFAGGFTDLSPDPTNIDSIRQAEDLFIDNWESYPTQRNALIDSLRMNGIDNVVFVTGDSHCSWSFDVTKKAVIYPEAQYFNLPQPNPYNPTTQEGYSAGAGSWAVEFGTPSISSANFDELVGLSLANQFEAVINHPIPPFNLEYNPHLKYVDLDRHGYILLDLTEGAAQADYYYMSGVDVDTTLESYGKGMMALDGQNRLQDANAPAPPKAFQAVPAPANPPGLGSGLHTPVQSVLLSCYPNPAADDLYLQLGFEQPVRAALNLYDADGRLVRQLLPMRRYETGVFNGVADLRGLAAGLYFLRLEGKKGVIVGRELVKIF